MEKIDQLVSQRRRLRKGEHLYRTGASLAALYAVRSGFLKSCVLHEDGREQVAGFHMMGDLLGMDAISGGLHMSNTVRWRTARSAKCRSVARAAVPRSPPRSSSCTAS